MSAPSGHGAKQFPGYGDRGDLAGARRSRQAFRLCVASCVLLTMTMWYSERNLRLEESERLYLSALEMDYEAAASRLLSAIEREERYGETSRPKYVQALAVRGKDAYDLGTFEKAYELDPANSMFAIRYGCRLFLAGRYTEAAQRFRDAAGPPENALPQYLEAASVARSGAGLDALKEAMVIVARTNNGGESHIFPKPFWFSTLPQDGPQYDRFSRDIASECVTLLSDLTGQVLRAVRNSSNAQRTAMDMKSWLGQIQIMGHLLVGDAEDGGARRGSLQAITGISIELAAVRELQAIPGSDGPAVQQERDPQSARLQSALNLLSKYEDGRGAILEQERAGRSGLLQMILAGGLAMLVAYALALLAYQLIGPRPSAWTLPHSGLGKGALFGGSALLFVLLCVQPGAALGGLGSEAAAAAWWAVLGALVGFGWIYPALMLPLPGKTASRGDRPEEAGHLIALARRVYQQTYATLALRYYGILTGLLIGVVCAWLVTFRMITALYPWQFDLLPTQLLEEEAETVARALVLL